MKLARSKNWSGCKHLIWGVKFSRTGQGAHKLCVICVFYKWQSKIYLFFFFAIFAQKYWAAVLSQNGSKMLISVLVTSLRMNECGFALFRLSSFIVVIKSAFPKAKQGEFLSARILRNLLKYNLIFPASALQVQASLSLKDLFIKYKL